MSYCERHGCTGEAKRLTFVGDFPVDLCPPCGRAISRFNRRPGSAFRAVAEARSALAAHEHAGRVTASVGAVRVEIDACDEWHEEIECWLLTAPEGMDPERAEQNEEAKVWARLRAEVTLSSRAASASLQKTADAIKRFAGEGES